MDSSEFEILDVLRYASRAERWPGIGKRYQNTS